jgi:16S rRNA (guanine527-N7)-methyltransferase
VSRKQLAELERRWALPAGAVSRLARLLELLAEDPTAPTSVTDPARAITVHVEDSLTALGIPGFRELDSVVDIGAGAGFPGLALAAAQPGTRFDLVESVRRKCDFLERAIAEAAMDNARVICSRAEEWAAGQGREAYGGAVVRAVAPLPTLLEYAAPLLRVGAMLVAWKGRREDGEEKAAAVAAETLGMRLRTVEPVAGTRNRHLYVYEQREPAPPGYPRRPGMARKRPLGAR